jgi:hypothetical protein
VLWHSEATAFGSQADQVLIHSLAQSSEPRHSIPKKVVLLEEADLQAWSPFFPVLVTGPAQEGPEAIFGGVDKRFWAIATAQAKTITQPQSVMVWVIANLLVRGMLPLRRISHHYTVGFQSNMHFASASWVTHPLRKAYFCQVSTNSVSTNSALLPERGSGCFMQSPASSPKVAVAVAEAVQMGGFVRRVRQSLWSKNCPSSKFATSRQSFTAVAKLRVIRQPVKAASPS